MTREEDFFIEFSLKYQIINKIIILIKTFLLTSYPLSAIFKRRYFPNEKEHLKRSMFS